MKEALKEIWELVPMKARYSLFFTLGLLFVGTVWFTSCDRLTSIVKNYPQDNPAEELIEDIIENVTGLKLDLSPNSEEKN